MRTLALVCLSLAALAATPDPAPAAPRCPGSLNACPTLAPPHRSVRPHWRGRRGSSVRALGPEVRGPRLALPGFTERPVLPGRVAPEPFLQNNLPPVFAPQPAQ